MRRLGGYTPWAGERLAVAQYGIVCFFSDTRYDSQGAKFAKLNDSGNYILFVLS